jgi:TolA-binding protein
MKPNPLAALVLAAALPAASLAQKKEIQQLQREIGLLRDDLLQMQQKTNESLAAMKLLIQTAVESSAAANRSLAVLDAAMRDRFREQEKHIAAPVAGLSGKVDAMADEFRFVKESVVDLGARLGKLQQQLVDIDNAIKILQAPPAPPATDPAATATPGAPAAAATPATPPPGTSAKGLYDSALRDKSAGNYDLAIQEFSQYLQWFGTTDLAPNAQFYIGEIQFNQNKYEEAIKAFDAVLERYPRNNKTLDAKFMKGKALVRLGRRNDGAQEFREILSESRSSEIGSKAAAELRSMGLSTSTSAPRKQRNR